MTTRVLPLLALALIAAWPAAVRAAVNPVEQPPPTERIPPLKVTVIPQANAPVTIDELVAKRDVDGNIEVSAAYRNTERKAVTAIRIRFDILDPFDGPLGYFNGVSQAGVPALKSTTSSWNGDRPYPLSSAIHARVTDVAFADGSYWQAPDAPNPVIAAEHHRLLQVYRDGGVQALLKALNE